MDAASKVISDGTIYLDGDSIVAVSEASAPAPAGWQDVAVVTTGGTIFPGLIELHNHLAYNTIGLWEVTGKFADRDK